jgi:PD-(D/E)XK nuclease superfamily
MKPHLYINSRGYHVTRHSYSGSESFNFCARKYYLERVQGWTERTQRSGAAFGIALEKGVTFFHQHHNDVNGAVAEFSRLWAESKEKPLVYSKVDCDWDRLSLTGPELIRLYAIRYPSFPFVVDNPRNFQIETSVEVFPDSKLAGVTFTSYIDLIATLKSNQQPIILDCKTSALDVPSLTVLDPQLRSYAWIKKICNVGFLWFRKCGREFKSGDVVSMLQPVGALGAGDTVHVLAKDEFSGLWLTGNPAVLEEMNKKFEGKTKAVLAAKDEFIKANGTLVPENMATKQRVQYKLAVISEESAEDIGRSIKRDIINIAAATEKDFFPMQSGVRFPNEKCPNCAMRGICSGDRDLRDQLLVRNQLDEFDFGKESE